MARNSQKFIDLKEEAKIAMDNIVKFNKVHSQITSILITHPGTFNMDVLRTLCKNADIEIETFNFVNDVRNEMIFD